MMHLFSSTALKLCIASAMLLAASGKIAAQETKPVDAYELVFPAMGTQLAFQSYSDDEARVERAFKAARREVDRLVDILSDYSTESETVLLTSDDRINQWQDVSPELWEVLQICDQWHRLSDGAFDASIGRLTSLWRRARKSKTLPTSAEIEAALKQCGWKHLHFNSERRQVKIDLQGLKLDFGAMGKGYIIDRAYDVLKREDLPVSLVRAGGDLRCGSAPPGKKGWPVELAKLSESEEPVRIYLANAGISSSGDLYQFMDVDGVRRSHVLDPRTGLGVPGPRMVTVIATTSAQADAADTAMCVMDDQAAIKVAQSVGGLRVRLATLKQASDEVVVNKSPGF